ncbi:hypothetical protein AURDEDRAFT_171584 [Auricularia subglabra TFB-10046 SS5]|nr:hypothetical protein AURDEDRAFT_171584 [Auricularia subglabra TFB-10046 SS5]
MSFVENPSRLDGTVSFGSFVLLTVDIASSVRGVTDDVAIRAAEALPPEKCLAWIRMNTSYPGSPLFYVVFLLVDRCLPAPHLSFAAVPIAPNTPHPDTDRPAVEPSRPFPWPGCYLYTLQDVTAPISRIYESPGRGISLDADQKKRVLLACYEDADAREEVEHLDSDSPGSDDFGLPPGWRIRDHGDYGSVVYGDSKSGSNASSRSGASGKHVGQGAADDDASMRSSSEPESVANQDLGMPPDIDATLDRPLAAEVEVEQQPEEKGIVLHVEVSGVLEPSDEFGSAADFLSVVKRLSEMNESNEPPQLVSRKPWSRRRRRGCKGFQLPMSSKTHWETWRNRLCHRTAHSSLINTSACPGLSQIRLSSRDPPPSLQAKHCNQNLPVR